MSLLAELDREEALEILSKRKADLAALDEKRAPLIAKIQDLESKLAVQPTNPPPPPDPAPSPRVMMMPPPILADLTTSRAPKGENLRRVRDYLAKAGKATTGDIATALSLTASSVSSVLCHHPKYFLKEADGPWTLKPSTPDDFA